MSSSTESHHRRILVKGETLVSFGVQIVVNTRFSKTNLGILPVGVAVVGAGVVGARVGVPVVGVLVGLPVVGARVGYGVVGLGVGTGVGSGVTEGAFPLDLQLSQQSHQIKSHSAVSCSRFMLHISSWTSPINKLSATSKLVNKFSFLKSVGIEPVN